MTATVVISVETDGIGGRRSVSVLGSARSSVLPPALAALIAAA